jgi:hypothetical protein
MQQIAIYGNISLFVAATHVHRLSPTPTHTAALRAAERGEFFLGGSAMQAMLASLKEKTKALAASVLPEGTPSIPAKPVVWGSDLRAVREAMQGTIVKFGGTPPTYLIGPCNTDLNKSGTKVALSIHGRV